MNAIVKAHIALFVANLIYGASYSLAKSVMPEYIGPFGFILTRVTGAALLFWLVQFFTPREKIARADYVRIAFCALFGVAMNQLMFFTGLNITTPINASIIMTLNPVLVLIISSILIREMITGRKLLGIFLGASGALLVILMGKNFSLGSDTILGDFFILINATSYAIYLVIVKPLMYKYHPLTIIKWAFLIGWVYVFPFGFSQFLEVDWLVISGFGWFAIGFIVIGTTFLAYLLNIYALKTVNPSVVSIYIYFQPILAAFFAIIMNQDEITWNKVLSTALIFIGVYLVSVPARRKA